MRVWPSEKATVVAASGRDHEGQGMAKKLHSAYSPSATLNAPAMLCMSALASLGTRVLLLDIISTNFDD